MYNKPIEVLSQIDLNYETPWSSRPGVYAWEQATSVPPTEPHVRLKEHVHQSAIKKIPEYSEYLKFKQNFGPENTAGLFFSTLVGGEDWKIGYLDKVGLARRDLRYGAGSQLVREGKVQDFSEGGQTKLPTSPTGHAFVKRNMTAPEPTLAMKKSLTKSTSRKYDLPTVKFKKRNNIKIKIEFKKPANSSANLLGLGRAQGSFQTKTLPKSRTSVAFGSNPSQLTRWGGKLKEKEETFGGESGRTNQKAPDKFVRGSERVEKNKEKQPNEEGTQPKPRGSKTPLLEKVRSLNFKSEGGGETDKAGQKEKQTRGRVERGRRVLKQKAGRTNSNKPEEPASPTPKAKSKSQPSRDFSRESAPTESYRNYFTLDSPEKEHFYKDKLQERYYRRLSLATSTPIWNANYQTSIFLAPDYSRRRIIQGDNRYMNLVRGKEITSHFRRFKPPSNVKYTNPYDDFYRSRSVKRLLKKRTTSYVGKNNWQLRRILHLQDIKKKRKKKPRIFYHFKLPLYKVGSASSSAPENFVTSLSFNSNLFDKTRHVGTVPAELSLRKLSNRTLRYSFLNKNRVRMAAVSSLIEKNRHVFSQRSTDLNITKNPDKRGKKRFSTKEGRLLRKKFRETKRWRRRKYISYYPRLNKLIFGEYKSRNWAPNRVGGR